MNRQRHSTYKACSDVEWPPHASSFEVQTHTHTCMESPDRVHRYETIGIMNYWLLQMWKVMLRVNEMSSVDLRTNIIKPNRAKFIRWLQPATKFFVYLTTVLSQRQAEGVTLDCCWCCPAVITIAKKKLANFFLHSSYHIISSKFLQLWLIIWYFWIH